MTQLGDLYRLEDLAWELSRCDQLCVARPDKSRAVVFAFQLEDGPPAPVYPQGLDPKPDLRCMSSRPGAGPGCDTAGGEHFHRAELMRDGIMPSCKNAVEASVIELNGKNFKTATIESCHDHCKIQNLSGRFLLSAALILGLKIVGETRSWSLASPDGNSVRYQCHWKREN